MAICQPELFIFKDTCVYCISQVVRIGLFIPILLYLYYCENLANATAQNKVGPSIMFQPRAYFSPVQNDDEKETLFIAVDLKVA